MKNTVNKIISRIKGQFEDDATGHDWHHIMRVYNMSCHIQSIEGGNREVIEYAALLHDISDHKFNGGKLDEGGKVARALLQELGIAQEIIDQVKYIVDNVSYKGSKTKAEMNSLEGKIVQDADRLDAIGAIGIARTFAYGGNRNQAIYSPELQPTEHTTFEEYHQSKTSTINHFYEKLLLLKDRMNTPTGIKIAEQRHLIMEHFLESFFEEWSFNQTENKQ